MGKGGYDYFLSSAAYKYLIIESIFDAKLAPHKDNRTLPLYIIDDLHLKDYVRTKIDRDNNSTTQKLDGTREKQMQGKVQKWVRKDPTSPSAHPFLS